MIILESRLKEILKPLFLGKYNIGFLKLKQIIQEELSRLFAEVIQNIIKPTYICLESSRSV